MSDRDDLRYYGLYNLVEVKATGRIGLYTSSVHAPAEKGGDWLRVRFDDGSEWRYRPAELKKAKPPNRIFDTERYALQRRRLRNGARSGWIGPGKTPSVSL